MNNIAMHISTVLFKEYSRTFLHIYKTLLYFNFLIDLQTKCQNNYELQQHFREFDKQSR